LNCRLVNAVDADVDADSLKLGLELVDVGAGEGVTGACCGTLMFEMLRLNVASGPVYAQWICVIPHVNISPACGKTREAMMDERGWASAGGHRCNKKRQLENNDMNEYTNGWLVEKNVHPRSLGWGGKGPKVRRKDSRFKRKSKKR
jgi:hypothetical protein